MASREHDPTAVPAERAGGEEANGEEGERRRSRLHYGRSELENLRFHDLEEQKRRWGAILRDMDGAVVREYDHLAPPATLPKKPNRSAGAQQSQNLSRRQRKREEVLASACGVALDGSIDGLYLLDSYCHLSSGGHENAKEDSVVGEEEYEEEDEDSDEEYGGIRRAAFYVSGDPDFESGPPQDGLEYLRRVRWEANRIPDVKVAKLDSAKCSEQTPYMPKIPEIPKCPEKLMPLKRWEDSFIADFSELRESFSHVKSSNGESHVTSTDKASISMKPDLLKDQHPTVSTILKMDPISRAAMLKKLVGEFESVSSLSREKCSWIFALCVAVDTPFGAGMSATMRCLLRKCSCLLAAKAEVDDEAVMLNVLAIISGKYFGQSDK